MNRIIPSAFGPDEYFDTDRFDLIATARDKEAFTLMNAMLQGLLAERFGLIVHHELRATPVYMLEKARDDGKFGPGLKPPSDDCTPYVNDASGKPMYINHSGFGSLSAKRYTMGQLAGQLGAEVHDLVMDGTSLNEQFDIELTWAPNLSANTAPMADNSPSLLTALREQLGLKLVRRNAPLDNLIIERLHKPTSD